MDDCEYCTEKEHCDDGDPCTMDRCTKNECVHKEVEGCGTLKAKEVYSIDAQFGTYHKIAVSAKNHRLYALSQGVQTLWHDQQMGKHIDVFDITDMTRPKLVDSVVPNEGYDFMDVTVTDEFLIAVARKSCEGTHEGIVTGNAFVSVDPWDLSWSCSGGCPMHQQITVGGFGCFNEPGLMTIWSQDALHEPVSEAITRNWPVAVEVDPKGETIVVASSGHGTARLKIPTNAPCADDDYETECEDWQRHDRCDDLPTTDDDTQVEGPSDGYKSYIIPVDSDLMHLSEDSDGRRNAEWIFSGLTVVTPTGLGDKWLVQFMTSTEDDCYIANTGMQQQHSCTRSSVAEVGGSGYIVDIDCNEGFLPWFEQTCGKESLDDDGLGTLDPGVAECFGAGLIITVADDVEILNVNLYGRPTSQAWMGNAPGSIDVYSLAGFRPTPGANPMGWHLDFLDYDSEPRKSERCLGGSERVHDELYLREDGHLLAGLFLGRQFHFGSQNVANKRHHVQALHHGKKQGSKANTQVQFDNSRSEAGRMDYGLRFYQGSSQHNLNYYNSEPELVTNPWGLDVEDIYNTYLDVYGWTAPKPRRVRRGPAPDIYSMRDYGAYYSRRAGYGQMMPRAGTAIFNGWRDYNNRFGGGGRRPPYWLKALQPTIYQFPFNLINNPVPNKLFGSRPWSTTVVNAPFADVVKPSGVAFSEDGEWAFVTLAYNNGIAVVDLRKPLQGGMHSDKGSPSIVGIICAGSKDMMLEKNQFDASMRDGVRLRNWPVQALYQPWGVKAMSGPNGSVRLITANSGVVNRERMKRVKDITLVEQAFTFGDFTPKSLSSDKNIGELFVFQDLGRAGLEYERLFISGARSVSIWDVPKAVLHGHAGSVTQLYDSGDTLEKKSGELNMASYNGLYHFDDFSAVHGVLPKEVESGYMFGKKVVFVSLQGASSIAIFSVAENGRSLDFLRFLNSASSTPEGTIAVGGVGPDDLQFVPQSASSTGCPLLYATYPGNSLRRGSGNVAVWELKVKGIPCSEFAED